MNRSDNRTSNITLKHCERAKEVEKIIRQHLKLHSCSTTKPLNQPQNEHTPSLAQYRDSLDKKTKKTDIMKETSCVETDKRCVQIIFQELIRRLNNLCQNK
eukprot:gnl/MRDRNA2_/MRDRNA2_85056_c0_seq1.p2 gnl/MRDRNA2_/MRDRNA2_85056_c0~~gnl/MRDRNA2_/MRDRNA2_85056_c0_seq1.p2  ORF type:complete len:101 (+),score=5.49 gnl/MRDRNA2_/MRDRNA2_85056_c0_seq1:180-482(+)